MPSKAMPDPGHAEVAVGAVVQRGDEILLIRRGRGAAVGQWAIPGGRVEFGERLKAAVAREVREETGLEVRDLHVTRIFNNAYAEPGGKRYPFYFVQFVARAANTRLAPDDHEVREARWFDDLPPDMAFRDDYAEDFRSWRGSGKFDESPGKSTSTHNPFR